jgi:hypothetical protein
VDKINRRIKNSEQQNNRTPRAKSSSLAVDKYDRQTTERHRNYSWRNQQKSQPLIRQVIILSLLCVSVCFLPLRLAAKVENLDSGAPGKHRCLQSNTKQKVEGTDEKIF